MMTSGRLRRRTVVVVVGAVTLMVLAVGGIWLISLRFQARDLRAQLTALEGSAATLASGDAGAIESLESQFEDARPAADRLRRLAWPIRPVAIAFGWLPFFGDDLRVARSMVDRLPLDLESASAATRGAIELRRIYGVVVGPLDEAYRAFLGDRFSDDSRIALQYFTAADLALAEAEDVAPDVPAGHVMGWLRGDADRLDRSEARLRQAVDWGKRAAQAVQAVGEMVVAAQPAIDDIDAVLQSGQLDVPRLVKRLDDLQAAAANAEIAVHAANVAAPPEFADSDLYAELPRLEAALRATQLVAAGGGRGLAAGEDAFQLLSEGGAGLLADGPRLLQALQMLHARHDEFAAAAVDVEEALDLISRSVTDVSTEKPSLLKTRLTDLVQRVAGAIVLARDMPEIAPALLGADRPRTYLLLGQTSDELRAGGGFVSGVWVVTFAAGELISTEYRDVVGIDDLSRLDRYPKPPQLLETFMNAPVWLMRDATWDPDFPSTAEIAEGMYRLGTGEQVDGVVAVTPWAFLRVANAFGSITTPNGNIPADQLLADLETGTDTQGRQYMDAVFEGLLDRLDAADAPAHVLDVAGAVQTALEERQALVYLNDPAAQRRIEEFGWSGELNIGPADRVVIVDSNVGWSKVDRNIERGTTYRIELSADGPSRATLSLRYRNLTPEGAALCDSQYADRENAYESLKNACYWNLMRAFIAPRADLVSMDALPLPRYSVAEEAGYLGVGSDTAQTHDDAEGTYVSGLFTVAPAETRTVTMVYTVPDQFIEYGNAGASYSLVLQPQPGTLGRRTEVEVVVPDGYRYAGGSITPSQIDGDVVRFKWLLLTETLLTVDLVAEGGAN